MRLFDSDCPGSDAAAARVHLLYDGDHVPDALIRSAHFAVHVDVSGGISVLAMRDDGCVEDAVLDDDSGGTGTGCVLTIRGSTGTSVQPSAAAAMAEFDWRNAVMQVAAAPAPL